MKSRIIFYSILLCLSLFLSCEKDYGTNSDELIFQNENQKNEANEIKAIEQIPIEVRNEISKVKNETAKIVDNKAALSVIDSVIVNYTNEATSYTSSLSENILEHSFQNSVIAVDDDGSITSSVIEYYPKIGWKPRNKNNYSDFTGKIIVYNSKYSEQLNIELIDGKVLKQNSNTSTSRVECSYEVQYAIGCAYTCWISSISITATCEDKDPDGSSGGSNGGGSTGGTSGSPTISYETINITTSPAYSTEHFFEYLDYNDPPDCASFNFQNNVSGYGDNWQVAAVAGIYFNIAILKPTAPYVEYEYTVRLNNPVLFGAPENLVFGGDLGNVVASEASARALHQAMRETAIEFAGKKVSESAVDFYFKNRIKYNYPLFVPGGRAETNPASIPVPITNYSATIIGFGNCD